MLALRTATSTSASSNWFASWFDSPHYHTLYAHRSDAEAAGFIDALVNRLQPYEHDTILDLGCGAGRHAKYLASKGFCVTGLDLSADSIRRARRAERPGLRFLRHDMRLPFGAQAFDYVMNLFTSFGYFDEPAEHYQVLRNIAIALRPSGRLVLDYLNVAYAEARLTPSETTQADDTIYRITRWSDATHFYKRIAIDDDPIERGGAPRAQRVAHLEHVERVAKFSVTDFATMFAHCGLTIEAVYGDYALRGYDARTSPRMILIARRSDRLLP